MVKWILAAMLVANCLNAFGDDHKRRMITLTEVYARAERGQTVVIAVGIPSTGDAFQCSEAPQVYKGKEIVSKPNGLYTVSKDAGGTVVIAEVPKVMANDGSGDGLDEVNAKRAARGLRPFIRDDSLTVGAKAAAAYRASRRIFGHVMGGGGDFQFLPSGVIAKAAGCAANEPTWGFMACCVYDSYTYAGAAYVIGSDGRMYCHLFVR